MGLIKSLFSGLRLRGGSFRRRSAAALHRSAGIRHGLDSHQILIRNFPAKMLVLPALLDALFQKDRASGIRHKQAGSGQKDIPGAVLHLNFVPEEG